MLSLVPALALAAIVAFGTQAWSTMSRGMWSHTWLALLLGLALFRLLRHASGRSGIAPVWLGSLLAWAYFVRPTASISVVCVVAYVSWQHRRALPALIATLGIWLLLFVTYSLFHFDTYLPGYFTRELGFRHAWTGLAGILVSPAKGIVIYVPTILFLIYLLGRYRPWLQYRPLAFTAGIACALHVLAVAGFDHWWAGWSYGPRLLTDMLPWLVLLAVIAVSAWLGSEASARARHVEVAACAVLVGFAVMVHAGGALSQKSMRWNESPNNIDFAPQRNWDWRDPQFLAWALPRPEPEPGTTPRRRWKSPPPWR